MQVNTEAAAQRTGHEAQPGRRPHKRKPVQRHAHSTRSRSLPHDNIQLEILHCRIKDFFHGYGHAVDLVYEQNVVALKIRQYGSQIAGALQHGTCYGRNVHAQFSSHDLRKRGLAEARIAIKNRMIQ